jgi:hypothetical protein
MLGDIGCGEHVDGADIVKVFPGATLGPVL